MTFLNFVLIDGLYVRKERVVEAYILNWNDYNFTQMRKNLDISEQVWTIPDMFGQD